MCLESNLEGRLEYTLLTVLHSPRMCTIDSQLYDKIMKYQGYVSLSDQI